MKTRPIPLLWIITILFISSFALAEERSRGEYQWVDTPGEHLELQVGGDPVVRYMYAALDESSPEARAKTYKPYLHVFSPDGQTLLTKGPGGLYPHHRGIYFGFNKITYGDGKKADTWHCTGKAHQSHQDIISHTATRDAAIFRSTVSWHGAEGEAFASEERSIIVFHSGEYLLIDFESYLTPIGVEKIHLDGDPQHAGVQFRASQQVADKTKGQTYYLRTDGKGKPGETRNWNHQQKDAPQNEECTNRPWNAMSIVIDDQRFTVLYLDHPDNPKPARYSERDYGRFGSFFVAKVTAEEPLDVQYRFVVKEGQMTVDECQSLCNGYVEAN